MNGSGSRHPDQGMFPFGDAGTMASFPVTCPTAKPATLKRQYVPLGSVWEGEDAELLERMLDFYPRKRPKRILDATVNGGRFWRGSNRPVIGSISPFSTGRMSRVTTPTCRSA